MATDLTIRPARREDFAAWLVLWQGYNAFYGRSGETALPDDITRLTWNRFFDGYEPMECMVAESDSKLVGLVHIIFHRSTTLAGPTCYLQDLFADATRRGQGIGWALIEAVYVRAHQAGAGRVYWLTHETNQAAMRLYDQIAMRPGFVQYRKDL